MLETWKKMFKCKILLYKLRAVLIRTNLHMLFEKMRKRVLITKSQYCRNLRYRHFRRIKIYFCFIDYNGSYNLTCRPSRNGLYYRGKMSGCNQLPFCVELDISIAEMMIGEVIQENKNNFFLSRHLIH